MRIGRIAIVLAMSLLVTACSSGEDHHDTLNQDPADFSGRWAFGVQVTNTTCGGPAVPGGVNSGYFDITQIGSTLLIDNLDECGKKVFTATGTVNGSVAVIDLKYNGCPDATCCYDLQFTETVALSGDMFTGDLKFLLNSATCGTTSTPCEYTGRVTATSCPPGSCNSYPSSCQ